MTFEDFKQIAPGIPTDPGIYKYLNKKGEILYVGKSKNIKKRLQSYFGDKKNITAKTKSLLKNAVTIEFTIVETEHDALLLENSLIKNHQPRYNVMLKDGKSYTYLCIKNEDFPRVFFTRRLIRDGSVYFGPYTSKYRADVIFDLVKTLFPLRTCTLNLSDAALNKKKYKVCLEFHIKNCMGPCEKFESVESYSEKIQQIKNILKGKLRVVKDHIQKEMNKSAAAFEYERAHEWKVKLSAFEDYQGKSTVASTSIRDVDVFNIASNENEAFIHFLKVIDGVVVHTYTMEATMNLNEDPVHILSFAIPIIRERFESTAMEIIVPFKVELEDEKINLTVPKAGDKKNLLDLAHKNVQYHLLQKRKEEINRTGRQSPAERILKTLQLDLHMQETPLHIECFDNSNIQGSSPVSACVVFKNAKPSKKDYRHFHVKTVEGPDDFATMEEVVLRRYKRLLAEDQPLPQLVIIDGGKGQLSSAMKSIDELGIRNRFVVIGIAKKLEEIYFPEDPVPLHINKKSESLKLIQQLRNEAHRFGISFHRDVRSKNFIKSELEDIKGIGAASIKKLLSTFGSMKLLMEANLEDIKKVVGESMAIKLMNYFENRNLNDWG